MFWIIRNKSNPEDAWSNEEGWTDTSYDTYSDEEKAQTQLPIDGEWEQVPWNKA